MVSIHKVMICYGCIVATIQGACNSFTTTTTATSKLRRSRGGHHNDNDYDTSTRRYVAARQSKLSFEERMRKIALSTTSSTSPSRKKKKISASDSQKKKLSSLSSSSSSSSPSGTLHHMVSKTDTIRPSSVKVISTIEEFQRIIDPCSNNNNRIVVVRFYATWCKACQAVAPSYYKFAKKYDNKSVLFVDVPASEDNVELHQSLSIPSIPYGHIYWDGMLVDEQRVLRKLFPKFELIVKSYIKGESTLPSAGDCSNPYVKNNNDNNSNYNNDNGEDGSDNESNKNYDNGKGLTSTTLHP